MPGWVHYGKVIIGMSYGIYTVSNVLKSIELLMYRAIFEYSLVILFWRENCTCVKYIHLFPVKKECSVLYFFTRLILLRNNFFFMFFGVQYRCMLFSLGYSFSLSNHLSRLAIQCRSVQVLHYQETMIINKVYEDVRTSMKKN